MRKPRSSPFWFTITAIALVAWIWMPSCQNEEIFRDTIINPPIDTTAPPVSFKDNIIPLFNQHCNTKGCHGFGEFPPDLSPVNAYEAINTSKYIDRDNPSLSQLYISMETGEGRGGQMPPGKKITELNELVLLWIAQGALDN
jgi:hypothetical protein